MTIAHTAELLKLLGNCSRLTMLALLKEREMCVCELVEALGISQPAVSQHMRKLKAYDLVTESRRGQWVYYSLNMEDKNLIQMILNHLPSQRDTLATLDIHC